MNIPWFKITGVVLVSSVIISYLSNKKELNQKRESARIALHNKHPKELRKMMIAERFKGYPGNCPCPYDVDRRGYRCGKRSAYSKPGGFSPKCYARQISDSEINNWIEEKVNSIR